MSSLLQDSFVRPGALLGDGGPAMLPLDISENDNEFIVKASLPGVRPEDVQITVHGDTLTIRGETKAEQEKKDEHYHLPSAGTGCSSARSGCRPRSVPTRPRRSSRTES